MALFISGRRGAAARTAIRSALLSKKLVVSFLIILLAEISAFAQVSGGSISGRVTDALGGAVQDSLVTVKNQSTGEVRTLRTNDRGFYSFPNVASGRYDASVSHAGFGDLAKRNLLVNVGEELIVDFELNVGTVASSVDVPAESLKVSLASSTLSSVVAEACPATIVTCCPTFPSSW